MIGQEKRWEWIDKESLQFTTNGNQETTRVSISEPYTQCYKREQLPR